MVVTLYNTPLHLMRPDSLKIYDALGRRVYGNSIILKRVTTF